MDAVLQEIKETLVNGNSDKTIINGVIVSLKQFIAQNPKSDDAYFLLGNAYRRREEWGEAMNAFQSAVELNPNSPAKIAYRSIQEVLDFFNKDMFNQ